MPKLSVRSVQTLALVAWLAAVGVGFAKGWRFTYTPGPAAAAPPVWPGQAIAHDRARPTIVVVLHPECSCSAATLEELSRILAVSGSNASAVVLFDIPDGLTLSESNPLRARAAAMPGVRTVIDPGGPESSRFGALVSGQAFLYDADGRLLFSGGITPGRGHAGPSDGAAAIQSILAGERAGVPATPVFGCLLSGREIS